MQTEELCLKLKASDEKAFAPQEGFTRKGNWMSDLGHPCARYIYYTRTCGDMREPIPPRGMKRMWLGRKMEDPIRMRVRESAAQHGLELIQVGRKFYIPELDATGKVDDMLIRETTSGRVLDGFIDEIKTISDFELPKINSIDDMLNHHAHWQKMRPFQIMGYQKGALAEGLIKEMKGFFTLVGIPSGDVNYIPADFNEEVYQYGVENWKTVKAAMDNEEVPDRVGYSKTCVLCNFRSVCLPEKCNPDGMKLLEDEGIISEVRELLSLEEDGRRYKQLEAGLKKNFKETDAGIYISTSGNEAVEVIKGSTTTYPLTDEEKIKFKKTTETTRVIFSDLEAE